MTWRAVLREIKRYLHDFCGMKSATMAATKKKAMTELVELAEISETFGSSDDVRKRGSSCAGSESDSM